MAVMGCRWLTAIVLTSTLVGCAAVQERHDSAPRQGQVASAVFALPPIVEMPSPHFNERPAGTAITCIVLHHTDRAESAADTARFFQKPESQVSSHYIVDRDGSLIRCVPDDKRAWHAGVSTYRGVPNVNDYSIGIEIANEGDNVEPYPEAQMRTVIRLVAWLSATYGVPLQHVTRHRDVALPPGRKHDPSDNFDFARVVREAAVLLAARPAIR